ncbi:hypothetical protein KV64_06240 [Listeria monocytogenes]|nr:hypothetical protein [Listeria monocytogenes]
MKKDKLTMIKETFKNDKTGELTPGVTIILDGEVAQALDIIMKNKGYSDYPEALKDVIFEGIQSFIKQNN